MTLILNASTLHNVLDMPSTVEVVDQIFTNIGNGSASQPDPTAMSVPSADSTFVLMSAVGGEEGVASVKLLADIPSNNERGLPSQRSVIMLADHVTGGPLAILDGRVPTRMRTAAATAVATKYLARKDSRILGLVGAGGLAAAHVEAIKCVMQIDKIVVWSRTSARIEQFTEAVAEFGIPVEPVDAIEDVFAVSDVVCTLTPSVEPNIKGEWFRPGQHINAIGSRPRPNEREIDSAGMARAKVIVDHLGTAKAKSGEYLMAVSEGAITEKDIAGELSAVAAGRIPGRESDEEITLFNSVGIGALDLAIGRLAYDRAIAQGLGLDFNLSN
ncbi:ornithine cyclodeaminase family protein [Glutamicibacter sp.]|uniref:ornithine cyclodeaminase family protein n=1 Tax=Glutamicibacter sp. TaxID=1931995 RepID=UPI0028BF233C|nr:ornithine cyclodeaminase family protein [Glutamicibacter sp.]